MFSRILIANRGEIALRIIRAARELGIETVCVYSKADKDGPWLEFADRAVCIGEGPSKESYLRIDRIISAAEIANVDAIHPGYGFLAENAHFAEVCRDCHIEFIGPSPEAMALLGDKISCKRMAKQTKTPIFPGTEGAIEDVEEAVKAAKEIGKPGDIVGAVMRGIDMFDCVMPTRSGRTAQAFTRRGTVNLRNARHMDDPRPLDEGCYCPACRSYSRAYLHHLIRAEEMLGPMLLTWHNIQYYQDLTAGLRTAIGEGRIEQFAADFEAGQALGDSEEVENFGV
jgi:hypothetical protein